MAHRVPTTVVTGALGVGKTTAILDLVRHRPVNERWVVLVNEFGEVGIDGAILEDPAAEGLVVSELPGGCICCTGNAPMEIMLRQVLEAQAPERLLVEPSGVADAGRILDTLDRFSDRIDRRATITLVDPRDVLEPPRYRGPWEGQVEAADVLVGNRVDRCDAETVRAFLAWADGLYPPKRAVVTTVGGELDPAWLDWEAGVAPRQGAHVHEHAVGALESPQWIDLTGELPPELGRRLFRRAWAGPDFTTCGWRLPAELVFSRSALEGLLSSLCQGSPLVPGGAFRVKGVFHTDRGWAVVQADRDGIRWSRSAWRQDSRLEVIAGPRPGPDWVGIDAALMRATANRSG